MFESKITDKRWLSLGLVSDLGWLVFFVGLVMYMINGADGLGTAAISVTFLLTVAAALFVLAGIISLISQRARKLSRRLTGRQLVTGFYFSVYGALCGGVCAGASVLIDLIWHYESGICFLSQCLMCAGGLLCFAFGLPILQSFKKVTA